MKTSALGALVYTFFVDHLRVQKGLRPMSIRSYRDAVRLFLNFVAADTHRKISRLSLQDLTFERVLHFLRHLEEERHNHIRTRNQRRAVLVVFFNYLASQVPEMLVEADRVAAIPTKRAPPPETQYLNRDEVRRLLRSIPKSGMLALRDRTLILFLYNTGARVQEVADLRVGNLDLGPHARVRLHGKGDKWRSCPLWTETTRQLHLLLEQTGCVNETDSPVFVSRSGSALTRYGIYKIVRRHAHPLESTWTHMSYRRVTPHVLRHTTAVHLLESGVEVNVIRSWLGHVCLETTCRYAEISTQAKEDAVRLCEPSLDSSGALPRSPIWRNDKSLLAWLDSL